jgi:site-specific recombinase XerD
MPTIKAVLRPPKGKDGKKPIYIRISDAGKSRYVSTGIKVKPKYWNKNKRVVRENDEFDALYVNKILSDKLKALRDEAYQLQAENQNVNADILKNKAKANEYRGDFLEYANKFAKRKRRINVRTGKKYESIINKVEEYSAKKLSFKDITITWLKDYTDWLAEKKKNSPNTIHSNLKSIRTILYEAMDEGLFPQEKNPFFKFKLKQPKVHRDKLTIEELKALIDTKTNENPVQEIARDMFLFSFFSYGMRFSDVATLKIKNIEEGYVRYRMGKTERAHSVKIFPPLQSIIDKYAVDLNPDDYLFPLLNTNKDLKDPEVIDQELSSKNAYVNKELNILRKEAKINKRVSFHVARHSYADIARKKGTDLHSISNSLGHTSLKTTESYLKGLDNETTDKAVQSVYEAF